MSSERPEFRFDNPFKVDVSGFCRKKTDQKKETGKKKKKAKAKKPKDSGDAEAAKAVVDGDGDDAADETKPIIAATRTKEADKISLRSTPQWLPMPKLVMAAFIINMAMILVAVVLSGLVLGGSINVKANAIGLTQSLVLFSAVFGLVYIGFHCFAARKALGVGLFRRRHRRPLHTTIVQIGRITVSLWLVSILAVGITIAKEASSEAASLSLLKAELACCLTNGVNMLVVVFVVECTRMPFVLPWISPPVPEGEALSLHAKALIDDILDDGVAGHSHGDAGERIAHGSDPIDTPVMPPAAVEADAITATVPSAAPAAFMFQTTHMPPPAPIYPMYMPHSPYGAYQHPYATYAPAPVPSPDTAPATAPPPPLSPMATPQSASTGQSGVRPMPSVPIAIPPQTPSMPIQTLRAGSSAPEHHSRQAPACPGMHDAASAASAVRSEIWSRADEGAYATAPADMRTPAHDPHSPSPYHTALSSGHGLVCTSLGQRPPLSPFAPLSLSSYVSPMQSSPLPSMHGPRPAPSHTGWSGRSGRSRYRHGRGGGDESGYYEPVPERCVGPRSMPSPARPRVEGKLLFDRAAEGLKAKENGRSQESAVWEDWRNYKIPGSWW